MRDLLNEIKKILPSLSKGQRQIAGYILEHYDKAAYMTAAKLGAVVDVSESTVVRFAIEAGFDGYPDLQRALQEMIRTRLTSVQRMDVTDSLIGAGGVLERVLLTDAENIKSTLDAIDRKSFAAAADRIIAARNIYIAGMRSSSALASFLYYGFTYMFGNVRLVQTPDVSGIFEQILRISRGDVMIAISFPRYSKRIISAVEYARGAGAGVVALTDGADSPIAPFADELLLARSDMASFVDSLAAPLSIINALIVEIARKKRRELDENFYKLEKIWDEYDVYTR